MKLELLITALEIFSLEITTIAFNNVAVMDSYCSLQTRTIPFQLILGKVGILG